MNTLLKYRIILFFFISVTLMTGQNQASNWYFGNYAGLSFNTTPPTILYNSAMSVDEGSAVVSDPIGNLLFYTDGDTVWNQTHVPMANGYGLFGTTSPTQSSIIIKQPGNNSLYFIFTATGVGGANGLCYSIVDMNLAAGMGSVTVKNIQLYTPTCEKLTATKHSNGTDIWVVSHDYMNDNFRAFLITSSGINISPVISSAGWSLNTWNSFAGQMKLSPNGRKIAYVAPNYACIFDFNNLTGVITNSLLLGFIPTAQFPYGCEFSSDGTKFYAAGHGSSCIYQWDLSAGSNSLIVASQSTIGCSQNSLYAMQLALDGKIYIAQGGGQGLSIIGNPNNLGITCNFLAAGQSLGSNFPKRGMPTFMSSYFKQMVPFSYTVTACKTLSFSIPTAIYNSIGYNIINVLWSFGEPSSGVANNSTLLNPTHFYSSVGTYTVKAILYEPSNSDTIIQTVNVTNNCDGLTEVHLKAQLFQIYPNPANNNLLIVSGGEFEIDFLDCLCQLQKKIKIKIGQNEVDLSNYGNGVYYLKETSSGSYRKLIIFH